MMASMPALVASKCLYLMTFACAFLASYKPSFRVLKRFCSIHHGRQIGDPDSLWTGFRVVIGINNFMEICERGIHQQLLRKLQGQSQLTANELDLDLNTKINILGTLRPWQFSCQTLLTRKPGWSSAHPGISSWSGGFVEKPRAIMKCHLAELGSSSHGRIQHFFKTTSLRDTENIWYAKQYYDTILR